MQKMIKVSKLFNRKIAQVTSQVYHKFVQLNNKAQALAMDIYDEMDDKFLSSAQTLSQKVLLAADKIYRKGMSADEMRGVLSTLNSMLAGLMINPQISKFTAKELSEFKSLLGTIIPVDVPAQSHVSNMLSRIDSDKGAKQEAGASKTVDFEQNAQEKTSKNPKWLGLDPMSYVTDDEDDGGWDLSTYKR